MKEKVQTRQDLLYLLAQASELEHSLACQYLYSAFSLKRAGEGVTEEQAKKIEQWRSTMINIAVEEMLHLTLASNLLTSIGGAPYLRRANFPQPKTYSSLGLDFRLARASAETIRRYICFELPPKLSQNSRYSKWINECRSESTADSFARAPPLLPMPFDYKSIGELYRIIEDGFLSLYPQDASMLFIGSPQSQTEAMWKSTMAVKSREDASTAIDLIVKQGEGAYGNDDEIEEAHFGKFVAIYDSLVKGDGGQEPAWSVVENPILNSHPDIEVSAKGRRMMPTILTADIARGANEIFVSLYELAIQILMSYFAKTSESDEQQYILKQVFLSLMRYCISPLGTAIARLPAFKEDEGKPDSTGPRAGASFEFYADTVLLPHLDSSWRYFEERLREIAVSSGQLSASEATKQYPLLREALTGDSTPAHPGIAAVCKKYEVALSSGRNPPAIWTWENGTRSFFSPLDIERMLAFSQIDLRSEQNVLRNKQNISKRIDPGQTNITMPPQILLDDQSGGPQYRNPEGTWTRERIENFRKWAKVDVDEAPFVCPENPTWESDVKNWFTPSDVSHMKPFSIDLSSYDSVKKNVSAIEQRISDGSMPPGNPWSLEKRNCFKKWIENGSPRGDASSADLKWFPTSAPTASRRYDDVFFIDEETGWAVNSNYQVIHTVDGGSTWTIQIRLPEVDGVQTYPRCIMFANKMTGFLGTLSPKVRLYTTLNGGQTWTPHSSFPEDAPLKICGLYVVNERVVYGTGTNDPKDFAAMVKTVDGGKTWTARNLEEHASILIDNYFFDENRGIVVGGYTDVPRGTRNRNDIQPVILRTEDGGKTWTNLLKDFTSQYPKGEWGWKIDVLSEQIIFVSMENLTDGAIAKTVDGGKSWVRLPINDDQRNANLEGIGFVTDQKGWVGGWGDADFKGGYTSATLDGGLTWKNASEEVGTFINRFRFLGSPVKVGYAAGKTVYKYSSEPPPVAEAIVAAAEPSMFLAPDDVLTVGIPFLIKFKVPTGVKSLRLHIWSRFGSLTRKLLSEEDPVTGVRSIVWDGTDDDGEEISPGPYVYCLRADERVESRIMVVSK